LKNPALSLYIKGKSGIFLDFSRSGCYLKPYVSVDESGSSKSFNPARPPVNNTSKSHQNAAPLLPGNLLRPSSFEPSLGQRTMTDYAPFSLSTRYRMAADRQVVRRTAPATKANSQQPTANSQQPTANRFPLYTLFLFCRL